MKDMLFLLSALVFCSAVSYVVCSDMAAFQRVDMMRVVLSR